MNGAFKEQKARLGNRRDEVPAGNPTEVLPRSVANRVSTRSHLSLPPVFRWRGLNVSSFTGPTKHEDEGTDVSQVASGVMRPFFPLLRLTQKCRGWWCWVTGCLFSDRVNSGWNVSAKSIPATSRGRFVLVCGRVARSERNDGRGELRTDLHPVRTC